MRDFNCFARDQKEIQFVDAKGIYFCPLAEIASTFIETGV